MYDSIENRIAFHSRHYSGKRYVTATEHMPENHKAVVELNNFDGTYYRQKAAKVGDNACKFVCNLLDSAAFGEQVYKSCMAVINYSRTYGSDWVDRTCAKAIALKSVNYTTLKNTLKMVRISSLLTKSPLMRTLQLPSMKSLDK